METAAARKPAREMRARERSNLTYVPVQRAGVFDRPPPVRSTLSRIAWPAENDRVLVDGSAQAERDRVVASEIEGDTARDGVRVALVRAVTPGLGVDRCLDSFVPDLCVATLMG